MAANFTLLNPDGLSNPGTRFSHTARIAGGAERLLISGQVGQTADGVVPDSAEEQMKLVLANLSTCLAAHGLTLANVVRIGMFITDLAHLPTFRALRGEAFAGHAPTSTLLVVAGLAHPKFLVEIEAEAVFPS